MAFADVQFASLNSTLASPSFTHTPTHVPKVVIVTTVFPSASTTSPATVTYGTSTLSLKAVSKDSAGEPGTATIWARTSTDATFSSGAATVAITGAAGSSCQYVCMTVAATDNITVSSTHRGVEDANSSAASVAIAKGGALRWAFGCKVDGTGAPTSSTNIAGQVNVATIDFGAMSGLCGRESTAGTADITFGWAQAADDWALVAITIEEVAGGPAPTGMKRTWRMGALGCGA